MKNAIFEIKLKIRFTFCCIDKHHIFHNNIVLIFLFLFHKCNLCLYNTIQIRACQYICSNLRVLFYQLRGD